MGDDRRQIVEPCLRLVLDNPAGTHPKFDSAEAFGGYRVIKWPDQASMDFLTGSVAKIGDAFVGLKLKLIAAKHIPSRPRERIWLPPLEELGENLNASSC